MVVSRLTTTIANEEGLTGMPLRSESLNGTSLISGNHIFVTDPDGLIVSCSDELYHCQHLGRYVDTSYIEAIDREGCLDTVTQLGGLFSDKRYVFAMPITQSGAQDLMGYIFVSTDRSTIIGAWQRVHLGVLRRHAGGAVFGAGALAWWCPRRWPSRSTR